MIRFSQAMPTLPEVAFSLEEKHQALDLVLHSQTFARADQLKKFLRYICDMEESGRAHEITEYSIGTDALGRPRNYSPAADSGVRGRAHDLRQKLDHFYELESPGIRVRIALRKGSYTPYFYEAAPQLPIPPVLVGPTPVPPSRSAPLKFLRPLFVNLLLIAVAVAATRAVLIHNSRPDPIIEEFWGPMVHPGADVLLCLAAPPSLLIKPFREPPRRTAFRPVPPDTAEWYSHLGMPDAEGQPYMYHSLDSAVFGDVEAAVFAAETISAAGGSVDFLPENILRAAALRNRNVLLIGGPNYSAYAARVLRDAPFTIREDRTLGEEVIEERSPESKKSPLIFIPKRDASGQLASGYGLITIFSNQTLQDQTLRTVVISGVTGAGSGAAMHFFASPGSLRALRDRFRKDGLAHPPASYQLVIQGSKDRGVALTWELAAYRVMRHPPTLQ